MSVDSFQFLNYYILIVEVNVSSFRKHISKTEDLMPLTFVCGTSCCSCRLSFSEEEKFLIEFGNVEMHLFPINKLGIFFYILLAVFKFNSDQIEKVAGI